MRGGSDYVTNYSTFSTIYNFMEEIFARKAKQ